MFYKKRGLMVKSSRFSYYMAIPDIVVMESALKLMLSQTYLASR